MKYYIVMIFGILSMLCNDASAGYSTSVTRTFIVKSCAICDDHCPSTYFKATCTDTKGTAQAGDTVEVTSTRSTTPTTNGDVNVNTKELELNTNYDGSYTCVCTPKTRQQLLIQSR